MNILTVNFSVLSLFFVTPYPSVTFIEIDVLFVPVIVLMYMN